MKVPKFRLIYEGRDISADLAMWPTSIVYTDRRHGESDEVTVAVHNSTGDWLDAWKPEAGHKFSLDFGNEGLLVPAGEFTVDEHSARGDARGESVDFKGLSAPKNKSLRTTKHKAYEQQSLKQIVEKIAGEHGLKVEGEIDDIEFERITQDGKRDLEFLRELADDYGHYFTVKGSTLVFTSRDGLRARTPVRTIDRVQEFGQELLSYELRDADHEAASKAEVRYHHSRRKKVVSGDSSSTDDLGVMTSSGDVVKLDVRVENPEQAKRVAKSRLDKQNAPKEGGRLQLVGDPLLIAGQVIELTSFGKYSGRYLIASSTHEFRRSGYQTHIDIERITDKQRAAGDALRQRASGAKKAAGKDGGADNLGVMGADGIIRKR